MYRIINAETRPRDPDEPIDKTLKRFRRLVKECGVLEECRDRMRFAKPSVKRHKDKMRRKYIQSVVNARNQNS